MFIENYQFLLFTFSSYFFVAELKVKNDPKKHFLSTTELLLRLNFKNIPIKLRCPVHNSKFVEIYVGAKWYL